MALVEDFRHSIEEVWNGRNMLIRKPQLDVIYPDSGYSPEPITQLEVEQAVDGLPYVYAFARFYPTKAIPFSGWKITCRSQC